MSYSFPGMASVAPAVDSYQTAAARRTLRAVYLHSGWRCGSTYMWNKFRESGDTFCYYEPFHEDLARAATWRMRRKTSTGWAARHPAIDRPYMFEYRGHLGFRGVRGYRQSFALGRFFPQADGIAPEAAYLRGLAAVARENGRYPVFGFCRSLGRLGLLKRVLPGLHLVLRRDPVQQWLSCRSYRRATGESYFEACHFLLLALAPERSPAWQMARLLGIPRPPEDRPKRQIAWIQKTLYPWTEEFSYRAFMAVTLLAQVTAEDHADLVVDLDSLSRCPAYRVGIQDAIYGESGHAVSFDDCRMPVHGYEETGIDPKRIEYEVRHALNAFFL